VAAILEVRDLKVEFPTRRGTLLAVDGVSFSIAPGEVLGVVGESGAGKSLTGMAIIGLLEPPGRIAAGEVRLEGRRIDNLPHEEMRRVRGRRIGMVFQDPLTSLNPLYTVGDQLVETILTHLEVSRNDARTVRGSTLVEKNKEYVQAARVIGRRPLAILATHVLPNVLGPVLVIATINIGVAIITEATLSFLGVGVPATTPSLGTLIRVGNEFLYSGKWWITVFPGAALVILVLSVNLLGDWLRDALSPKLR